MLNKSRCNWCLKDELYIRYHDEEWGVPVFDDNKMFEFLTLETFQAGLSWYTVLAKRENFRSAFYAFNAEKMAAMQEKDVQKLLQNPGIIRNQAKIRAAIHNAKLFLEISDGASAFSDFLWSFSKGKTLVSEAAELNEIKATTKESDVMSKELKARGFKFVGSTVCYAHMQATGIVNDHLQSCFRYNELKKF
jgi:DNA-3-methyladenine glycosylase I